MADQPNWRELCRRLYVELFHCDQQMRSVRKYGKPLFTQGSTVRDVLCEAKSALDAAHGGQHPATPDKCDGNHGGPRCADPECWNDSPEPSAAVGVTDELARCKRIKSLLQDTKLIDSHTISAVVAECDAVILARSANVPETNFGNTTERKGEPVALQHMAVAEDGVLRWMTGRKIDNCELYAMPDFGRAPTLYTSPQVPEGLTVRLMSFPETNGRRNWTAMFVRIKPWYGLIGNAGGITIARGECWNRVAYAVERARCLLGERKTEPDILAYGEDVSTPEEWAGHDPDSLAAIDTARKVGAA